MKLITVLRIAALAGTCSLQAQVDQAGQTVFIYVSNRSGAPQSVTYNAQMIAGKMFGAIGVNNIKWQSGAPSSSGVEDTHPIILTITDHTPDRFYPGELASALPFEGVHIRILYDRLGAAVNLPNMGSILLAHVMAHEIGHMLQGVARHSASGLMRARWTHEDYLAMQSGELRFDPFDVKLIQNGLKNRIARLTRIAVAATQ